MIDDEDDEEERDSWMCSGGCGCGLCVAHGEQPVGDGRHMIRKPDGTYEVCGMYQFAGHCCGGRPAANENKG